MEKHDHLKKMLQREKFKQNVLENQTGRNAFHILCLYAASCLKLPSFWCVMITFVAGTIGCSLEPHEDHKGEEGTEDFIPGERGICAGPSEFPYHHYFPTVLNTLATFFLVFYASQVYGRYCKLYTVSSDARIRCTMVVNMAAGTGNKSTDAQIKFMDLWRFANATHIASYEALDATIHKDMSGRPYSLNKFLKPLCSCFGEEEHGLITAHELRTIEILQASPRATKKSSRNFLMSRLYNTVNEMIAQKLTTVPWPAWQAVLAPYQHACKILTIEADYTIPLMYSLMIAVVVNVTLVCDVFILSTMVAHAIQEKGADFEHGWFICTAATILVFVLTFVIKMFECLLAELQNPYGEDAMDFPILTWLVGSIKESMDVAIQDEDGIPQYDTYRTPAPSAPTTPAAK